MYIDTHCHLDDNRFIDLDSVVKEYEKALVKTVIHAGCNEKSSEFGKLACEKYDSIYFSAGFHPSDCIDFDDEARLKIERLLSHKKCVAVGEIGLDYHYEGIDKEKQKQCFISQIELAKEYNLPICVHMRDATEDTINILKEQAKGLSARGVIHCYSGSVETAKILLDLGFMLSFGGTVTFKNAKTVLEVAKFTPIDCLLTETDSPYLAPTPYRGLTNTPKNVAIVTNFLATLKNVDCQSFSESVLNNAKKLFYKL